MRSSTCVLGQTPVVNTSGNNVEVSLQQCLDRCMQLWVTNVLSQLATDNAISVHKSQLRPQHNAGEDAMQAAAAVIQHDKDVIIYKRTACSVMSKCFEHQFEHSSGGACCLVYIFAANVLPTSAANIITKVHKTFTSYYNVGSTCLMRPDTRARTMCRKAEIAREH